MTIITHTNNDTSFPDFRREQEANAARVAKGQQLYAKVKKSSKYFYQNAEAQRDPLYGLPFRVLIDPCCDDDFCAKGGPGGQYRLADIDLYVVEDGRELRIL
jgi:hypothetical protein